MAKSVKSITEVLLRKNILHCAVCKNLLLSIPVMLVENTGNLCSTCYNENYLERKSLQNTALEDLVATLNYPCRFRDNGCETWSSNLNLFGHEENCPYRSKRCPMSSIIQCPWEGFASEFVGHFINCHGEHIINFENGLFYLDITFSENELIKLLVMKNIILLLKMHLSLEKNKLMYMLCNVKDGASNYYYSVKHKGNNDTYLKTRSKVLDSICIYRGLEEGQAVNVDLVSLQHTIKITNRITNIFKIKTYNTPVHYIGETLLQFFECPVCKSFMRPPIYQCQSGHSICNSCKPRLDKCPTCRAPFGIGRNYSLEALTSGVSYPCVFHDLGCMMSLSQSEIALHEGVCPYKPYHCPFTQCTMTGTYELIMNHLQEFHPDHLIVSETNGYTESLRLENNSIFITLSNTFDRKVLIAFDHIFRLTCKRMSDYCMWAAEAIGVQNESKKFVYEVSIFDTRHPEKLLIQTNYCLNETSEEDLFRKCIIFPNSILSSYCVGGIVSYHFKIKKEEECNYAGVNM